MIVVNRKSISQGFTEGEVPGTTYGLSSNGWMNQDLFNQWFTTHFLQYATRERPVLLLMDGHSSHYSPSTVTAAADNGVILFTLPPNTTHITQPLDRACFAPLKSAWRDACHRFITDNPGKAVTHYDFNKVFAEAWYKAMTIRNVMQSFKVTGIYPFNRMALPILRSTPPKPEPPSINAPHNSEPPSTSAPSESEPSSISTLPKSESAQASPRTSAYDVSIALRQATSISKFLTKPQPPCMLPTKNEKSAGLVLTSEENLRLLKKKQQAKVEKAREKEEKRQMKKEKANNKALKMQLKSKSYVECISPCNELRIP